jgi:polysaccharide biosynthesis/export protein
VVRPGAIIRVPPPPAGNVYTIGQINRGGVYAMADKLTLRRLIAASGGFNAIAIPERIDLTRMVGPDRQATIRLNGRAIFRGTHPDIFLKANDEINVGTSFWATPMAVIRNGFRATYGFGFLLDRNFGNDVFGAPPANRFGQ